MSRILNDVKRSLRVQPKAPEPAPADTAGLGDALAQVIRAQVAEQVKEAVKQAPAPAPKVAPHLREFTSEPLSSEFPQPPPMAKKPIPPITLQKDRAGKTVSVSVGSDLTFTIQRDAAGKLIGMTQE